MMKDLIRTQVDQEQKSYEKQHFLTYVFIFRTISNKIENRAEWVMSAVQSGKGRERDLQTDIVL